MSPQQRPGLSFPVIAGFWLLGLFVFTNGVLAYYHTKRVYDGGKAVADSYERRAAAAWVLVTMRDAETGQRGYLLTGQEQYLAPFLQAKRDLATRLVTLGTVQSLGPAEDKLVDEMRAAVDLKMKELEYSIALRREKGFDAALALTFTGEGLRAMDEIRRTAGAIREMETQELERRGHDARISYYSTAAARALATLVGLALVYLAYRVSDRYVNEKSRNAQLRFENAERFRVTLSAIGDAVVVTDEKALVRFMNPVAEALTGWSEGYEGRPIGEVFHIQDESSGAPGRDPVARVLKERKVVGLENHTELVRRDGSKVPIDDSAAPIFSVDGELTGVVLVFRDIAQRRKAEMLVRSQKQALEEGDRRKDEFLAVLAHELRNPLGALRNAAEVLRLVPRDSPEGGKARSIIERQVRLMGRMVDDLIDISRISSGRMVLRRTTSEIREVVEAATETTAAQIQECRHELAVRLPAEPLFVDGDPVRLAQVLTNLLSNASKFTDPGGRIEVGVSRAGRDVKIVVRDNGGGMGPDLLPHVFDLFRQGHHTTGSAPGGLGVGLTLARRIVEMHGGRIEAASPGPGLGSTFTVTLPASSAPTASPESASSSTANPHRVLIIEDNPDARESLETMLRLSGHEVTSAPDGAFGLRAAKEFRPTVALVDLGLPDMSGHDVARALRSDPAHATLSLVAVTGWAQEEDRQRSVGAGFEHHLVKPVEPGKLFELLSSLSPRA